MGSGFSKMKKQARLLETQMGQMQKQIQETEVTGTSGNGLVTIVLNGSKELKSIKIKPECVDPNDVEGLQHLIQAAYRDAAAKVAQQLPGPGGLPLGFPLS